MILGIIPARAGSKRLPGKNVKLLAGKPMIDYTIEAARGSKRLDNFLVTTENQAICVIARAAGAIVYSRPANMAGDDSSIYDTIFHVLEHVEGPVDLVVLLQPTSPLRTAKDIDDAIRMTMATGRNCVTVSWDGEKATPNGAVFVASVPSLRWYKSFTGPGALLLTMPAERSVDVDYDGDFELAERYIRSTMAGYVG